MVTPIEDGYDLPDRLDDQLDWLRAAGLAPEVVWAVRDLARRQGYAALSFSRQSGSSPRSRATRSPSAGCVTNIFASPSSANGFTV